MRNFQIGFVWMIAIAALCSGCGWGTNENPEQEPAGTPFANQVVDVAVPVGRNLKTDWEVALNEWSALNNATSQLQEYKVPNLASEFPALLKTENPKAEQRPEVLLIPWSAVPELAAKNGLSEMPEALKDQEQLNWLDVLPGLRNRATSINRKPCLIPISCPVLVCYYRKDLLDKAGLTPPETWSEYQTLLDTLPNWAPGLTAVEPWGEDFRASLFLARAASVAKHAEQFSFCHSLRTGESLIDNPGFVESLKQAKAAIAKLPEAVKTYTPADCRREILTGRAALAIAYETRIGQDSKREENLEIGICQLPGSQRVYNTAIQEWVEYEADTVHRVTFTGFTGWAIGVTSGLDSTANSASWEFARYMTIDQLPTSYPPAMLSICRGSQTAQPSRWTGASFTTTESEQYAAIVREALRNPQLVMEFPVIGGSKFRAELTKGLTKALTQPGEEAEILKSVASEWGKIRKELGQENVANSYQQHH